MCDVVRDDSGETVEIPLTEYDVDAKEQPRFSAFLSFFDEALQSASDLRSFRLAARRYLRATRIAGLHSLRGDHYEDALLQYVFALETLLLTGDRTAIADKLATRAAWLVGTDDTVRGETFRAVKELYEVRSSVVHATKKPKKEQPGLDGVRDLLRRILVGLMAVR